jgi:ABC-type sugar transport system ATPase subunit
MIKHFENIINTYDFLSSTKPNMLIKNNEHDELVNEFWENPNMNLVKLKKKHGVNESIYEILKKNMTETYSDFLKTAWSHENTLELLKSKYLIKVERMTSLMIDIPYTDLDLRCPECLKSSDFMHKQKHKK